MLSDFKKINVKDLSDNVFKLLDNDWMLVTAGSSETANPMTASWGGFGILWNRPIAISFIRPQRHTYKLLEKNDNFTLSFFSEEYRSILNFCGQKSGRDINKIKETGLIPLTTENGAVSFKQARLILVCKKLYVDDINPDKFIVPEIISKMYPGKDFHRFYIGEILECYQK